MAFNLIESINLQPDGKIMKKLPNTKARQVIIKNYSRIYLTSFSDYKKGFGGQFGVQSDRVDKSAAGWEEHEKMAKHESQTG